MNVQENITQKPQSNLLKIDTINLPKPRLRGVIHAGAFILTCLGLLAFLVSSCVHSFNLGILIYLISQLLQFGISSFYHIPNWSPRAKLILRYLDHSCIFLLISGTQTSIIINNIPKAERGFSTLAIKISWAITAIGISRFFIFSKLYDIFDLICYICHGAIVLPFLSGLSHFGGRDIAFMCTGGLLYVIGGIVYGMEWPNPIPSVLGFHEIFHIFTVLANACFGIVISRNYIASIIQMVLGTKGTS